MSGVTKKSGLYVVLGMHRSGTSCLTGLLETCGLQNPDINLNAKGNGRGNRENIRLRKINNAILECNGGAWDNPPNHISLPSEIATEVTGLSTALLELDSCVIKDPRMVVTFDIWVEYLQPVNLIGSFRHPMSVAKSLNKRNGMPIDAGINLWTLYNQRLVERHHSNLFPLIDFDLSGENYIQQFFHLCMLLGLQFNDDEVRSYYSESFIRQSISDNYSNQHATDLYEYLKSNSVLAG